MLGLKTMRKTAMVFVSGIKIPRATQGHVLSKSTSSVVEPHEDIFMWLLEEVMNHPPVFPLKEGNSKDSTTASLSCRVLLLLHFFQISLTSLSLKRQSSSLYFTQGNLKSVTGIACEEKPWPQSPLQVKPSNGNEQLNFNVSSSPVQVP